MKAWCVFVLSMVAAAAPAAAQPPARVRALDPTAAWALSRGVEHSPRFRALLAELNASDVIVHVISAPALPGSLLGSMRFVARLGSTRYVRVELSALGTPDSRVAALAHELLHACEVARSTAASPAAVHDLYRAIGHQVPGAQQTYETDDAQRAGVAVWTELRGGGRSQRLATEQ
jgi:hypothetical protein